MTHIGMMNIKPQDCKSKFFLNVMTLNTFYVCFSLIMSQLNNFNIVAWNANGLNSRWSYLDSIRNSHDITFVLEHKMFACELFKLNDNRKNYKVYSCASRQLPDRRIGNYFGHGGIAVYWKIEWNSYIKVALHLSNDRI